MQNKFGIAEAILTDREEHKVDTKCYTYEVKMIIQVLADDETTASAQLDEKGGYVSDRKVKLIKSTDLSPKTKSIKE